MWGHNGQSPRGREAEGKPGGRMAWLHRLRDAFTFPLSFSPPLLAEPMTPSISLGTNSKAARFGQRKGRADIALLPQYNGERQSWKPRVTYRLWSNAVLQHCTHKPSKQVRKGEFLSVLVILLPDNLNVQRVPLTSLLHLRLSFHVGSTIFRRNIWLQNSFFIFKEGGLVLFPRTRYYKGGRAGWRKWRRL